MSPDKALELVQRYAVLNHLIKDSTRNIGNRLLQCKGISGKRQDNLEQFVEHDSKNRELDVHLTNWYTPEIGEYGSVSWEGISLEEHGAECCHCYSAHLLIQRRKELRQEFGQVKRVMSRSLS